MLHSWKPLFHHNTGGLKDNETGQSEIPHNGTSDDANLFICAINHCCHVHHQPKSNNVSINKNYIFYRRTCDILLHDWMLLNIQFRLLQ